MTTKKIETTKKASPRNKPHGSATAASILGHPVVTAKKNGEVKIKAEWAPFYERLLELREQLLRQNQIHGGSSVRVSAAHVLLAAGFRRGQTWKNVRLHPDHILKIENIGQASAQEIYQVVQEIIGTVKDRLGIDLEPEVRFLGQF